MAISRIHQALGVTAVAVLGLAACSAGSGAADSAGADGGDDEGGLAVDPELPAAPADFAGTSAVLDTGALQELPTGTESGAHAPGLALEVTGSALVPTISAAAFEDITGQLPPEADDAADDSAAGDDAGADDAGADDAAEETSAKVRAGDDHVFLLAGFETSDPQWEPRGETPETTGHLRVGGSEVQELFTTGDGARHSGTIVLSVPKDPAAEDAVIEIETAGETQQVSLLTGERTATDVPHAYPGPAEVNLSSAEQVDVTFDHFVKGETPMQGEVVAASTVPYLDRSDGGDGWAAPEQAYLVVDVDWHLTASTTYDETTIRAETGDEVFQPINDPSSLTDTFADPVVFQLPLEVTEVQIIIDPAYKNGVTSGSELLEFEPASAKLRIG